MNHEYFEDEVLYRSTTLSAGDEVSQDFDDVQSKKGSLYRYLCGFDIRLEGTLVQSAATTALLVRYIHGMLGDMHLQSNGHEFTPEKLQGADVRMFSLLDECLDGVTLLDVALGGSVGDHTSSLANDTADHAIDQVFSFRCAPYYLGLFGAQGRLKFRIVDPGDSVDTWGVKAATYITATVTMKVLVSPRKYLPRPTTFRVETLSKSPDTLDPIVGKADVIYVRDDADIPATYTLPTADIKAALQDNEILAQDQTGAELVSAKAQASRYPFSTMLAQRFLPLVLPPQDSHNRDGMVDSAYLLRLPWMKRLTLQNCLNDGTNAKVVRRIHQDASGTVLALWAAAMDVDVTAADFRSRLRINGIGLNAGRNAEMSDADRSAQVMTYR